MIEKVPPIKDRVKGKKYLTRYGKESIWDGRCFRNPKRGIMERSKAGFKEKRKKVHHRYTYGMSEEQYEALFSKQNGKCGVCEQDIEKYGRKTYIDHCHVSGNVRGLLCPGCNTGVGYLDKIGWLEKAQTYRIKRACGGEVYSKG